MLREMPTLNSEKLYSVLASLPDFSFNDSSGQCNSVLCDLNTVLVVVTPHTPCDYRPPCGYSTVLSLNSPGTN